MIKFNTLKTIPKRLGDYVDVLIPGVAVIAILVVLRGAAVAGHKPAPLRTVETRQCVLEHYQKMHHWALGLGQIYRCIEKRIPKEEMEDIRISRGQNSPVEAAYTVSNGSQREVIFIEAPEG